MTNKFSALRGTHRTPKICKPPPRPVPIPPIPPPAESYADVTIEWEEEAENGDGNGNGNGNGDPIHVFMERRIILVRHEGWFQEADPPPVPNVWCKMEIPGWDNGSGFIYIDLWAMTEETSDDKWNSNWEVDRADPVIFTCSDWEGAGEWNLVGEVKAHLIGPFV